MYVYIYVCIYIYIYIVELHKFVLSTRLPTTEGAPVFRLTVNMISIYLQLRNLIQYFHDVIIFL